MAAALRGAAHPDHRATAALSCQETLGLYLRRSTVPADALNDNFTLAQLSRPGFQGVLAQYQASTQRHSFVTNFKITWQTGE